MLVCMRVLASVLMIMPMIVFMVVSVLVGVAWLSRFWLGIVFEGAG